MFSCLFLANMMSTYPIENISNPLNKNVIIIFYNNVFISSQNGLGLRNKVWCKGETKRGVEINQLQLILVEKVIKLVLGTGQLNVEELITAKHRCLARLALLRRSFLLNG